MKLQDKVAIVTGSSRGIGKAIAIDFAREGADIVVVARSEKESEGLPGTIYRTAEEIRTLGRRALPIRCDITNEQDVSEMVRKTLDQFGKIDVLVNNAAIAISQPFLDMPLKRWELVLRVNVGGTVTCTKAVLPQMVKQKRGSIINVSSRAAVMRPTVSTGLCYDTSKAAVERFTWGLAEEVGKYNIAVNALRPRGPVSTEGMRFWNPKADWSRWDSPDLMTKAAIFLAAQDASGVTGIAIVDEELCLLHGL